MGGSFFPLMFDIDEKHRFSTISRTTCIPDEFYTNHQTYILCLDGSENAEYAFQWTISKLFQEGDHLMLLHVFPGIDISDLYLLGYDLMDEVKEAAEKAVIYIHY